MAFWSRKLQPRERRYGATELEGLAVVAAVNHFDTYLVTHLFNIETDYRALMFLNSAKHNNGRLARWAIQLQPYTFHIHYRPGRENDNADVLSRMYEEEEDLPLPRLRPTTAGGRCHAAACLTWSQRRRDKTRERVRGQEKGKERRKRKLLTSC